MPQNYADPGEALSCLSSWAARNLACHPEPLETTQGVESVPKDPGALSFAMLHQGVLPGMFRQNSLTGIVTSGTFGILRLARMHARIAQDDR